MKIKVFYAMSEGRLENMVNAFLAKPEIKVKELQFRVTIFFFSVMVVYEVSGEQGNR